MLKTERPFQSFGEMHHIETSHQMFDESALTEVIDAITSACNHKSCERRCWRSESTACLLVREKKRTHDIH